MWTGRVLGGGRLPVPHMHAEYVRRRCVLEGFEMALNRNRRSGPSVPKLRNGEQEAQLIALRLGTLPPGYTNWSLRLLARQVVEVGITGSISHETARGTSRMRFSNCKLEFWLILAEAEA